MVSLFLQQNRDRSLTVRHQHLGLHWQKNDVLGGIFYPLGLGSAWIYFLVFLVCPHDLSFHRYPVTPFFCSRLSLTPFLFPDLRDCASAVAINWLLGTSGIWQLCLHSSMLCFILVIHLSIHTEHLYVITRNYRETKPTLDLTCSLTARQLLSQLKQTKITSGQDKSWEILRFCTGQSKQSFVLSKSYLACYNFVLR